MFTVMRRYSLGVLKEINSKYEVLLVGEVIKMLFSAAMIVEQLQATKNSPMADLETVGTESFRHDPSSQTVNNRFWYITSHSGKMAVLAAIYGIMNILSFVSLRNIGAGLFTIIAQCKILTTATFSTLILKRSYTSTQWRALIGLMFGVLLFSEHALWGPEATQSLTRKDGGNVVLGTAAVAIEVTLSGFASIYFEKVIKTDPLQMTIWERNFQLALTSIPVYILFIVGDMGGPAGFAGGWTYVTWIVAILGATGGLLVALSIKYGDSILKTLATTGAIALSSVLDHLFLNGPLTPTMIIAGVQVILAIFNYTFDMTPPAPSSGQDTGSSQQSKTGKTSDEEMAPLMSSEAKTSKQIS